MKKVPLETSLILQVI